MVGGSRSRKVSMRRYLVVPIIILLVALTGCAASTTTVSNTPAVEAPRDAQADAGSGPDAAVTAQAAAPVTPLAVTSAPATPTVTPPVTVTATAAVTTTNQVAVDATSSSDVNWARTQVTATLYAAPDTTSAVQDTLDAGSLVVVTQVDGDWVRIIHMVPVQGTNGDSTLFSTTTTPNTHPAPALGDSPYAWVPASALTFATASATTDAAPAATTTPQTGAASSARSTVVRRPVTPVAAAAPAVTHSALSGTLVFQTSNGGTIYVYDLASEHLRALTGGFDPSLSPDGKTVAFTRVGGEQGVYLIDVDGSNERLIYGGSESLRGPHWSPDGRYIVFSRVTGHWYCRQMGPQCVPDRPGLENLPLVTMDKYGLSRVDRDGNDFRDIVALETATAPDWNAAGIVYQGAPGIQVTADQPDAANRPVVSSWDYHYQDPDWQPNGGRIVFQSKEGSHWEIFSVNADGTGLTALTKPGNALADVFPHNVSPAWSPDGQSIVFLSNRTADGSAGDWHLWVMNADGSNQRLLDPDVLGQLVFRYDFALDQVVDWQ